MRHDQLRALARAERAEDEAQNLRTVVASYERESLEMHAILCSPAVIRARIDERIARAERERATTTELVEEFFATLAEDDGHQEGA